MGKELSNKEYDLISKENNYDKLLQYVMNIITKKMYTEKEIVYKLKQKKASKEDIDLIIAYLKNNNLINDKQYMFEYKQYADEKKLGKRVIIHNLIEKGIQEKDIYELVFLEEIEKSKIDYHLNIANKKYRNASNKEKRKLVFEYLFRLGFEQELIDDMIKEGLSLSTESDEKAKIKNEIIKKNYINLERQKVIHKLLLKGFSYELICRVLNGEE